MFIYIYILALKTEYGSTFLLVRKIEDPVNHKYLRIENADGNVLIAVYLYACVRACVLFA